MGQQAAALADQLEQAAGEFTTAVAGLAEAQWRQPVPAEGRNVASLTCHVARILPLHLGAFRAIATGGQPPLGTLAGINARNAATAAAWADTDRAAALAELRTNAAAAAAELRGWDDAQLAREGRLVEELDDPLPVALWVEVLLLGHVTDHLRSLREALAATAPG